MSSMVAMASSCHLQAHFRSPIPSAALSYSQPNIFQLAWLRQLPCHCSVGLRGAKARTQTSTAM